MTLVLSDGLFTSQTEESIRRVVNAKWDSLMTLDTVAPIQTLDFCVSFSSVSALIGYYGQSNYAMANTIVDGYLARHKNAFSVSVPSISDLGYFSRYSGARGSAIESTLISPDGKSYAAVPKGVLKHTQQSCVLPSRTVCSNSTLVSAHDITFLTRPGTSCIRTLVLPPTPSTWLPGKRPRLSLKRGTNRVFSIRF